MALWVLRSRPENKSRRVGVAAWLVFAALVGGCAPTDDERCRSGWQYTDHTCIPVDEEDSATALEQTGTDTDLPQGLGRSCQAGGGQCEGLEASYCVQDPRKLEGYCTVPGCSAAPDDCPSGYRCCLFRIESEPTFCVTEADRIEMEGLCRE